MDRTRVRNCGLAVGVFIFILICVHTLLDSKYDEFEPLPRRKLMSVSGVRVAQFGKTTVLAPVTPIENEAKGGEEDEIPNAKYRQQRWEPTQRVENVKAVRNSKVTAGSKSMVMDTELKGKDSVLSALQKLKRHNTPSHVQKGKTNAEHPELLRKEQQPKQQQQQRQSLPVHESIRIYKTPNNYHICRIGPIAVTGNEKILLPKWMAQHAHMIASICGIAEPLYALEQDESGKFGNTLGLDLDETFAHKGDLMSASSPRWHIPHFASDMIKTIVLNGLFWDPVSSTSQHQQSRNDDNAAIVSDSNCIFLTRKSRSKICDTNKMPAMRPVLLISTKLASMSPQSWVQGFLRMVKNAGLKNSIEVVSDDDLFMHQVKSKAAVFRSMLFTKRKQFPSNYLQSTNFFFQENKLARHNATVVTRQLMAQPGNEGLCTVKVLIVNRESNQRQLIQPERIIPLLLANERINFEVSQVSFENISFVEQVRFMQEADAVISPHGAGNANAMFMRPESTLYEVMPFGYYGAGPFDEIALGVGANFERVLAFPDKLAFERCVNTTGGDPDIKRKLLDLWNNQMALWENPMVSRELLHNFDLSSSTVPLERFCARHQNMDFDIRILRYSIGNAAPDSIPSMVQVRTEDTPAQNDVTSSAIGNDA